jgi:uncharacterized membrane protein YbjE (DUF340 family)
VCFVGKPAELYNFWSTPTEALDEFGIGISLYFKTLKVLFVVLLLCALINLVSIYENEKFNLNRDEAELLNASTNDKYHLKATATYLLGSVYGAERGDLKLYKQVAANIAVCTLYVIYVLYEVFTLCTTSRILDFWTIWLVSSFLDQSSECFS